MKTASNIIACLVIVLLTGCASIPVQVVDGVKAQKTEIARVKEVYFLNMNNQLDAIEKYRYALIDIYESQIIAKYSTSSTSKTENGKTKTEEGEPTGDADVDHININHLNKINKFFKEERDAVQKDIQNRREQINLLNKNFENIEQINNALDDYMQSLKRLSNSQDKMAELIKSKIEKIIPVTVPSFSLPDPKTMEDITNLFKK